MNEWLRQVDQILLKHLGISVHDLADFDIYNTWRSGASPADGAFEALTNDSLGTWALQELMTGLGGESAVRALFES